MEWEAVVLRAFPYSRAVNLGARSYRIVYVWPQNDRTSVRGDILSCKDRLVYAPVCKQCICDRAEKGEPRVCTAGFTGNTGLKGRVRIGTR